MITHRNMLSALGGNDLLFWEECDRFLKHQGSVLLFLPLAHIMGRIGLYTGYLFAKAQGIYSGDISKLTSDI